MTPRKTDDVQILQMLHEDKSQKEIAEHFGVSPAAICKRVKLLTQKKPESFENLTEKEQRFAIALAEGKTQTQAALNSHDCSSLDSAKSMGHQLAKKNDIQVAVADLMQETGLTRRYRIQKLKAYVDHPDPNVSLKGLDQSWRLDAAYVEKNIHIHMDYEDTVRAKEIVDQKIKALEEKYGIRLGSDTIEEGEVVSDD